MFFVISFGGLIWTVVAWTIGALLLGVLLLGVFAFFYAFVLAPRFLFPKKPQTQPYSGQKAPRGLFRAFVREVTTGFLFYGSYLLWPLIEGYNLSSGRGKQPIIFVHGYAASRSCWWWFMRKLARRGVDRPMYALQYNWLVAVEDSAQHLAGLIDRALKEQGSNQVDIVAHSWGGFLARWCIERLNMGAKVRLLIMLATPNQGTWVTLYGCCKPAEQMSIGSSVVDLLKTAPPAPPYVTIWTNCDEIVSPAAFSRIADPDGNPVVEREFQGMGHMTLLRDNDVASLTAELLAAANRYDAPNNPMGV